MPERPYTGPVARHWSVDVTCRENYIEATILHMPTGDSRTHRLNYADYQDGSTWDRRYEAQADLFTWLADTCEHVGVDDAVDPS